jgi:hypothetical protein
LIFDKFRKEYIEKKKIELKERKKRKREEVEKKQKEEAEKTQITEGVIVKIEKIGTSQPLNRDELKVTNEILSSY